MTNSNERSRLKEILKILKKHKIVTGITPEKVRLILEDLGPTYIKLGQIMSMQTDTIPVEYQQELEKLRTDVPPMSREDLCKTINETYHKDIDEVFDNFQETPLGSASIAQAHLAYLKGTNTPVVLKIQRQGIYERMEQDIALMKRAAKMINFVKKDSIIDIDTIIDELWKTAQEELNFNTEAQNAITFYKNHEKSAFSTSPKIYTDLTNEKILVMENIGGFFIDEIEEMEKQGFDRKDIAMKLAEDYITQIIDDGFFHADPHPGNVKIYNGKIVWIDLGMMGRLSPRDKGLVGELVEATAKHDAGKIKDIALSLGKPAKEINHAKLYSDIDVFLQKYGTMDLGTINLSTIIKELLDVLHTHQIAVPSNISMLGRGIVTIEGVLAYLYPEINLMEITASHIKNNTNKLDEFSKRVQKIVMEIEGSAEKVALLPGITSDLLKMAAKGHLKINSELQIAENSKTFIDKMLNRLMIAMIAVAVIVGASLIALVEWQPAIFDIPIFTAIGYIIATILCITLFRNRDKG